MNTSRTLVQRFQKSFKRLPILNFYIDLHTKLFVLVFIINACVSNNDFVLPELSSRSSEIIDEDGFQFKDLNKNGNPNREGLPTWNPYAENSREDMRFGEDMGMIPVCSSEEKYDFLKGQLLGN